LKNVRAAGKYGEALKKDGELPTLKEDDYEPIPKSMGAAADPNQAGPRKTKKESLDNEGVAGAAGFEKLKTSPMLRMLSSVIILTRQIAQEMVEIPFYLKKHFVGEASPDNVEGSIRQYLFPMVEAMRSGTDNFLKYRGIDPSKSDLVNAGKVAKETITGKMKGDERLGFEQFREEITHAMRNGDTHHIPEVQAAAQHYRKVMNKIKSDAEEFDAFPAVQALKREVSDLEGELHAAKKAHDASPSPKTQTTLDNLKSRLDEAEGRVKEKRIEIQEGGTGVKGAASYFPRIWRSDKILANMPKLRDIIGRHISGGRSLNSAAVQNEVTEIIEKLLNEKPYQSIDRNVTGKASGLRERTLDIPDNQLRDFLENDAEAVLRHHVKTMGTDIQLTRKFGSVDMADRIEEIRRQWEGQIEGAKGNREKIAQLKKAYAADIEDIQNLRDKLRGTYGIPDNPYSVTSRGMRILKQFNSLLYMGSATVTALTDMGRPIMTEGVMQVLGAGVVPLVKGMSMKSLNLGRRETQLAGTALDNVIASRALSFADIGDIFGRASKLERGLEKANEAFFMANLLNPWTSAMKSWTGTIVMDRMLHSINKMGSGTISAKELRQLAAGGIDADAAKRIAAQYKLHGETVDGVRIPNTEKWLEGPDADPDAVKWFREALARDVDRTIVTPGVGDPPLFMSRELGSTVMQFKTFAVASANRVVISGLQERDMATLNGAMMMVGLGMMSDSIHRARWNATDERGTAETIVAGVDRSGLGAWFMDVNNVVETLSDGNLGIAALVGDGKPSSAGRKAGSIGGPSVGTLLNISNLFLDGAQGTMNERALRKLMPANNHLVMSGLFDQLESSLK